MTDFVVESIGDEVGVIAIVVGVFTITAATGVGDGRCLSVTTPPPTAPSAATEATTRVATVPIRRALHAIGDCES